MFRLLLIGGIGYWLGRRSVERVIQDARNLVAQNQELLKSFQDVL